MFRLRPTDLPEFRINLRERCAHPLSNTIWQDNASTPYMKALGVDATWIRNGFLLGLQTADLYWVSEPMADLAEAAGRTVPGFPLEKPDLPSWSGLMILDREDSNTGESDEDLSGLLWWPLKDRPDSLIWGIAVAALHGELRVPSLPLIIRFGTKWADFSEPSMQKLVFFRLMQAAWLLMQQPLAEVTEVQADRPARKRLRRLGEQAPMIRVIELRRPQHSSSDPGLSGREYQHQWIVKGHWRQQWYATRQVHRPVWIAPHVKGPEGAPMIGGEKVYAWKR